MAWTLPDAERIADVLPELRTAFAAYDRRTASVLPESRTSSVAEESRAASVPPAINTRIAA